LKDAALRNDMMYSIMSFANNWYVKNKNSVNLQICILISSTFN